MKQKYIIGFSSGVFYTHFNHGHSIKYLTKCHLGTQAIEVNLLRENELFYWIDYIPPLPDFFIYKSMHAPKFAYGQNKGTVAIFNALEKFHKKMRFDLIVFHPNHILDFSAFKNVSFPVAFENLDHREESGIYRTVEGMKTVFEKVPDAKMVLDVNHVYTIDTSMKLAESFYEMFSDRIAQIHLSGCEDKKYHAPLYIYKQKEIIKAIQSPDKTPIIVESVLHPDEMKHELEFILENL